MIDLTGLTEKKNQKGTRYFENIEHEIVAKGCTKCGEIGWLGDFRRQKAGLGERTSACKKCVAEYDRKYRGENHPERVGYYRKNLGKLREYYRKHREENRGELRAYQQKHREENRERIRLLDIKRRSRKALLPDTITAGERSGTLENFGRGGGCVMTGASVYHLDHVIPLTVGHGGTTYENIVPLRADLNISKHNACIFKWFDDNAERFNLSQRKFDELIEYLAEINEVTTKEYEEFVYWCHDNPRTIEEIEADNERYGYKKPSIEIWREEVAKESHELIEA